MIDGLNWEIYSNNILNLGRYGYNYLAINKNPPVNVTILPDSPEDKVFAKIKYQILQIRLYLQFFQLFFVNSTWTINHHISARIVFREGNHITNRIQTSKN